MKSSFLHKPLDHVLLIVLISLLAYSNTFFGAFHFDDTSNIVDNPIIRDLRHYTNPSTAEKYRGTFQYNSFKQRYVGSLSFALNYRVHGLTVAGYHTVNLVIHLFNALLVYALVVLTFSTPPLQKSILSDSRHLTALFASLLFASHPVQTQAITYIVQRFASLATLFYLLSLVAYIRWRLLFIRTPESGRNAGSRAAALYRFLLYPASLLAALLAMKTKQISFTLPVMVACYEFMFFRGDKRKRIAFLIPFFLIMLVIPLSLISFDTPIGELMSDTNDATRIVKDVSRWEYLMTQFRVIVTYIRLIFLPLNQNLDYDYPIYRTFLDMNVAASFLFLLTILCGTIYCLRRFRHSLPEIRIISFGIFWFFITLSVESGIIPLHVIFEHRLYLPSAGIFVTLCVLIFLAMRKLRSRWKAIEKTGIAGLTIVILALAGGTYARNAVWKTDVAIWEDVVRKSPQNERGHNNLGYAYMTEGQIEKAIGQLKTAIELKPDYPEAYINLGLSYNSQGRLDMAAEQFRAAIRISPGMHEAHFNLANTYKSQGLIDKAIDHYQSAIRLNRDYFKAYNNLGNAYKSQGLINKAIEQYLIAVSRNPNYPDPHINLGNAYMSQKSIDRAIEHYQIAIRLNPYNPTAYNNLGVAYASKGLTDKAKEYYETAIRLKKGMNQ